MMKIKYLLLLTVLLAIPAAASAEGRRIPGGETFLEQLQPRDSVLIADQLRYGIELKDIEEGTPISLPEFKQDDSSPLRILDSWQLDSTRVSRRKEVPARYDIKASLTLSAYIGGIYELPDIPVLVNGDTLVFKATAPLTVTELPVDMETFEPNDIKGQVKVPYTLAEIFPWALGGWVLLLLIAGVTAWLLGRKKSEEAILHADPPHIRALRKLEKYRGSDFWQPAKQKGFYSGVTDALREYIAARYGIGAMEMTTAEIFEGLKGTDIPEDLHAEMKDLFERADFVKFAKFTASDEENAQVLPQAVRFVTTTYQAELEEEMPGQTGHDEGNAGKDDKKE